MQINTLTYLYKSLRTHKYICLILPHTYEYMWGGVLVSILLWNRVSIIYDSLCQRSSLWIGIVSLFHCNVASQWPTHTTCICPWRYMSLLCKTPCHPDECHKVDRPQVTWMFSFISLPDVSKCKNGDTVSRTFLSY